MLQQTKSLEDPETQPRLLVSDEDHVRILTLNRPAARNSLSEAMIADLKAALDDAGADDSVRVVVIAASGPVFCAGHDLRELTALREAADKGRAGFERIMAACADCMLTIVRLPKPVIACVQGMATAAGCQLVASCDLAVASDVARFCTPGVNIGLFCSTPMVAVSRNMPRKQMMEMLLLGENIDAEDARAFGLINRVVPLDCLLDETRNLAGTIARQPRATVAIGKETFYRQLEMPIDDAYRFAADVMVRNMLHAEAQEGIGAFLEKRKPDWS